MPNVSKPRIMHRLLLSDKPSLFELNRGIGGIMCLSYFKTESLIDGDHFQNGQANMRRRPPLHAVAEGCPRPEHWTGVLAICFCAPQSVNGQARIGVVTKKCSGVA